MKKVLLPIILFVAGSGLAQNKPKAVLVDEFGRMPCDELGARASNLALSISQTPDSRALVISYPGTNRQSLATRQFHQILADFAFTGLDDDRLDFVLGEMRSDPKVEFWKVPRGAKEPDYRGERWRLPKPDLNKPFIYDSEDENGECSTFVVRKFAELLTDNPGSRAHIVVKKGGRLSMRSHGFADQWVDELHNKFGISKKRIRVFYGKPTTSSLTYADFWFVPSKRP